MMALKQLLSKKCLMIILITLCSSLNTAQADIFPAKTITIVVPTAPGGANDAMARIIAQGLSQT